MFTAIVQDHQTMLRAVKLNATTEATAVTECQALETDAPMLRVYFLIAKTGEIQRVYCGKDGYKLHRSAYKTLGKHTVAQDFEVEEEEEL